jgi:glycosyltransferase involved in cell wall biosynthesis
MRIMIGSESFHPNISGVAVAARNLATYMANQGHQVMVLAPAPGKKSYVETYPEGFEVYRLMSIPNPFRRNFRVTLLPQQQVKKIVSHWQPDVVHLEDPTSICSCLQRAAKAENIPVIISHHFTVEYILSYLRYCRPLHNPVRRLLTGWTTRFYNQFQQVVCPTETVRQWLQTAGVKAPIKVVSNGVNLDRFFSFSLPEGIRAHFDLPDLPIILYVGRVDPDKHLDTLIQSIPLILTSCQAHFVICGSGNWMKHLRQQVAGLGIDKHISFLGQLDHESDELPQLYQISACFVMPSVFETQSIVTMEAMAAGLPVVAAASGALPELVDDGENGFLFEPGKSADLAAKVIKIISKPELARNMGHQSLRKVYSHEIGRSLVKIARIYREVLDNEPEEVNSLGNGDKHSDYITGVGIRS